MPGPVVAKSWIRLPNDLVAPAGADTEIFRFIAGLDAGGRLIRLSVSGGLITADNNNPASLSTWIKTLGLAKPLPDHGSISPPPAPPGGATASGAIRFYNLTSPVFNNVHREKDRLLYRGTTGNPVGGEALMTNAVCSEVGEQGNSPAGERFYYESLGAYGIAEPSGLIGGADGPLVAARGTVRFTVPYPSGYGALVRRRDGLRYLNISADPGNTPANEFVQVKCSVLGEVGNCQAGEEFADIDSISPGFLGTAQAPGITGGGPGNNPQQRIFVSADSTEFVAMITGGQREFIIWMNPKTADLTLCGANGVAADYAWQAVLEDLGSST